MAVLPRQHLISLASGDRPLVIDDRAAGVAAAQFQPASIDLTLGRANLSESRVYGMRASALPQQRETVAALIAECANHDFQLDAEDKLLHRGVTYLIPLHESLMLTKYHSAKFSPKSSTGRVDILVRIIADGVPRFNHVPEGFSGRLYAEVTPLSFNIRVREGLSLVQMRIRHGKDVVSGEEIARRQSPERILRMADGRLPHAHELHVVDDGIYLHLDLDRDVVGFVARKTAMRELTLSAEGAHDWREFFDPIHRPQDGSLVINPGEFYLFRTMERVRIPHTLCADVADYDASSGEFRTHYAGFFDPGFGGEAGVAGVLEIRGREIAQRVEHGHPICRFVFEPMTAAPDPAYAGNYGAVALAKFFADKAEAWGS